jgi:hypothetical protein
LKHSTILPLAAVEIFVWGVLLISAFLISQVAFQINIGTSTLADRVLTQVVRNGVSAAIVLVWLLIWKRATDNYFWRTISRRRSSTSAS